MENRPSSTVASRAPSTGLKRSSTSGALSLQTRSMTKLKPTVDHLERLAGSAHEGKTVFGGVRRKRAPLMDALVNAAEEDRPRKIARQSNVTATMTPKAKVKPRLAPLGRPAAPSTPRSPFPIGTRILSASEISPAHSSSSEDSLLLKPTPRKPSASTSGSSQLRVEVDVYKEIKPIRAERMLFKEEERIGQHVDMEVDGQDDEAAAEEVEDMQVDSPPIAAAPGQAMLFGAKEDLPAAPGPRVLGSTTPSASRTTSFPRFSSSRGFAAPTLASKTKQVRTDAVGVKRPTDPPSGTNRLTMPTASSLAKAVDRSKMSAPPAVVSSMSRSGIAQVKRPAVTASYMDLASIAEGTDVAGKQLDKAARSEKQQAMSGLGLSGVSRPSSIPRPSGSITSSSTAGSVQPRRPSYPSSLGSGPLAHPVSRVVSNPHVSKPSVIPDRSAMRSVSDPLSKSQRASLSASGETAKSMHDLSAALAKLQFKKQQASAKAVAETALAPPVSPGKWLMAARQAKASTSAGETMTTERSALRYSVGPGYRTSYAPGRMSLGGDNGDSSFANPSATLGTGTIKTSIATLLETSGGEGALKGVTAYVDVRTEDGVDSGGMFIQLLRGCGARVLQKPSESVTHIIYKMGGKGTVQWYFRQPEESRPLIVGTSWITKSKEAGCRVDEEPYLVAVKDEALFQKRRKSMEPRQLAAMMADPGTPGVRATAPINPLLSIAKARKDCLQFAPRIGSPLKKAVRPSFSPHVRNDSDDEGI